MQAPSVNGLPERLIARLGLTVFLQSVRGRTAISAPPSGSRKGVICRSLQPEPKLLVETAAYAAQETAVAVW